MKLFFEKVYLHTDRAYYSSGEDIWFKAYLVNAQTHQLFNSSNNLYVELINPEAKISERKVLRLNEGAGKGDFKLGDSIASGVYRLRAYTNWMRNFGSHFFFEKKITVVNPLQSTAVEAVPATNQGKNTGTPASALASVTNTATEKLSFFPEGGSMITGVAGVVAFKAEDRNGKGMAATGTIETEGGIVITSFSTSFNGMGRFLLQPEAGKTYRAKGTFSNGKAFDISLPSALATGYGLYVRQSDSLITVTIKTNEQTHSAMNVKQVVVLIKSRGKTIYSASLALNEIQNLFTLPKSEMPGGISSITVYDERGRPVCERLIFIPESNTGTLSMASDKQTYTSKEKATVSIKTTGIGNHPVKANLSVAVVDEGIVPAGVEGNIVSYFNLQSELKGYIENPGQYFDVKNASRNSQLNLLLLCSGWRNFVWKRLAEVPLKITENFEQGITISGWVQDQYSKKGIPKANITLTAFGAKGNKLFATQADSSGRFYIDGVHIYGLKPVKVTATNTKGERKGQIIIDSSSKYPAISEYHTLSASTDKESINFLTGFGHRYEMQKKQSLSDTISLAEITIRASAKPYVTKNGTILNEFGFPVEEFKVKPSDHTYTNLRHFLTHRVQYGSAIVANSDFKGYHRPIIVVNGQEMITSQPGDDNTEVTDATIELFYSQSMKIIKDVKVKRLIGEKGADVYLLYLTMDADAFNGIAGSDSHTLKGYYEAREFYKPNHQTPTKQSDYRTTIHWEPDIVTNENGEANITYYNADPKTKVRVIVEGITDKGIPVSGTAIYEVQ